MCRGGNNCWKKGFEVEGSSWVMHDGNQSETNPEPIRQRSAGSRAWRPGMGGKLYAKRWKEGARLHVVCLNLLRGVCVRGAEQLR